LVWWFSFPYKAGSFHSYQASFCTWCACYKTRSTDVHALYPDADRALIILGAPDEETINQQIPGLTCASFHSLETKKQTQTRIWDCALANNPGDKEHPRLVGANTNSANRNPSMIIFL
jgi:hypothetical protein